MVSYNERYLNQEIPITIEPEVFQHWRDTERRTDGNSGIRYLLLCGCCKVVFPSYDSKTTRITRAAKFAALYVL